MSLYDPKIYDFDRSHWIHPACSLRKHEERGSTFLSHGKGMWLTDVEGTEYIDAFSGLWCVNVGYGQESIVEVASEQMTKLPYATGYFHFGSEPAAKLAEKLVSITPKGLDHVFFSQGGSDAVDSAVRYITYYYNTLGRPGKKQFIALDRGYHGSSSFGAGLTGLGAFHRLFDVPTMRQHHISAPDLYRGNADLDEQGLITASVNELKAKVHELGGSEHVAAFFCEPIQGSGGVLIPPVGWLKAMREACAQLDILFVVDEVITGFGRTGPLFACDDEGVTPDMMILAKGLTAGYAPMGALLMSDRIYQAIADGAGFDHPVGHGFTYSGHPVSAAIALEVIRLYLDGGLLANGQKMSAAFLDGLAAMEDHPLVGNVRGRGMLGAIELVANKQTKSTFDESLKVADRLFEIGLKNRVIFRSFANNIIGLAPALCCDETEMQTIFDRVKLSLDELMTESDIRDKIS